MTFEYRDACIFGRRRYELVSGTLRVQGSNFGKAEFELSLDLRTLDSRFDKLWLRSPFLFPMCVISIVGFAGFFIARDLFPSPKVSFLGILFSLLTVVGIVFSLLSLRRVPAVQIKNTAGVAVLDIFKAGPQKGEFDSFINELRNQIDAAKTG